MTPFTVVTGPAAPLMLNNVDTDVIIRIDRLIDYPKEKLGPFTLEALRYHADGSLIDDFVLNRSEFQDAPILIADLNFGCGSSREGAVFALQALGVRCIIAVSFGDIFFGNCLQNGVLAIRMPQDEVKALAELSADAQPFTVNLYERSIASPDGRTWPFELQELHRESLLEGLDSIGLTLRRRDAIENWERAEAEVRPWNCMVGIEG